MASGQWHRLCRRSGQLPLPLPGLFLYTEQKRGVGAVGGGLPWACLRHNCGPESAPALPPPRPSHHARSIVDAHPLVQIQTNFFTGLGSQPVKLQFAYTSEEVGLNLNEGMGIHKFCSLLMLCSSLPSTPPPNIQPTSVHRRRRRHQQ